MFQSVESGMVRENGHRPALEHVAVAAGTQDRGNDQIAGRREHDGLVEAGPAVDRVLGFREASVSTIESGPAGERVHLQHPRLGQES